MNEIENTAEARGPLLELVNVGRLFSDSTGTTGLRDASMTVRPGEFIAIVGPSGSGKSTLLNVLGLLDTPGSGLYRVAGQDVSQLRQRTLDRLRGSMFGFVFQSAFLLPQDTAASNVALGLEIAGLARIERTHRVTAALERLGMIPRAGAVGRNLSGGERQRIALARALAVMPEVLLADEPTGSLDSVNADSVIADLTTINEAGTTVIVVTHDERVAAAATRRVTIKDGVLADDVGPYVHLGIAPRAEHVGLRSARDRRGAARRVCLEILRAVSAHTSAPIRSLILIFAFLLGTGGLVSSIGVSQSASAQVSERLAEAALDEVAVAPSLGAELPANSAELISSLPGVTLVAAAWPLAAGDAPITLLPSESSFGQREFEGIRLVADSKYVALQEAVVTPVHSVFLLDESEISAPVAIIGRDAADRLGVDSPGPGVRIWVNERPVEVVGVLESSPRDSTLVSSVLLSPSAAEGTRNIVPRLVVRTEPGYPAPVAEAIPLLLNPASPAGIQVSTVADLRSLRIGVEEDLSSFLAIVSWMLLLLTCLSAGTAMALSVRTRAAEIALRRALGASRASIFRTFAFEGTCIGLAGGIAGAAAGLVATIAIALFQGWTPVLSLDSIAVGVLGGALSGLVSSVYPALVAATARPADAIRT